MGSISTRKFPIEGVRLKKTGSIYGDDVPCVRVYYGDGLFTDVPIEDDVLPHDIFSNYASYNFVKIFIGETYLNFNVQQDLRRDSPCFSNGEG